MVEFSKGAGIKCSARREPNQKPASGGQQSWAENGIGEGGLENNHLNENLF